MSLYGRLKESMLPLYSSGEISSIKVLGEDCGLCQTLYENARKAVNNMGLNIEVEYIANVQKVMQKFNEYGILSMPAFMVNEKIVSMGKVLKTVEIEKMLKSY